MDIFISFDFFMPVVLPHRISIHNNSYCNVSAMFFNALISCAMLVQHLQLAVNKKDQNVQYTQL